MKRFVCAGLVLAILLLTACSGITRGTDAVVPVSGYAQGGAIAISPALQEDTTVIRELRALLDAAIAGDVDTAFQKLVFVDSTFITSQDFACWLQKAGITGEYTLEERMVNKEKCIFCNFNGLNYIFRPIRQEDGSWGYALDDFSTEQFKILVPKGIRAKLDGKDISAYKETAGTQDVYTIPQIVNTSHKLTLSTCFDKEIVIDIETTMEPFDVSDSLAVAANKRSSLITTAGKTLASINSAVVAQDWNKFCKLLTPGIDASPFSAAFYKGKVKSKVYDLKMVETRDLEQSPLDVRYTGYNTVLITLGTRWQWGDEDNTTVDEKTGNFTIRKYSEMRLKSSIELYYDTATKKWYVNSIDDESLARLTAGLEQWK